MLMEKTLQVLKRALRGAGLLEKVVLVENFIDNEIVIKFTKRVPSKKDREGCELPVAFRPKIEQEPIADKREKDHDTLPEEDYGFEPADSTSHEYISLNESVTADQSLKDPIVKLNRLRRSNLQCQSPETQPAFDNDFDSGESCDDSVNRDDSDTFDDGNDILTESGDLSLETDPTYETNPPAKKKKTPKSRMIPSKPPKVPKKSVAKDRKEQPYLHCELCDYRHKSLTMLQRHVAAKHVKDKRYKCSLCRYRTSVEHYLYLHMKKHPGVLPWKCDECGHSFRTAGDLARHKAVCHEKPKSFSCQSCSFIGKNKVQFLHHVRCHYNEDADQTSNHHDISDVHCMLNTEDVTKSMCNLCGRKYQSGIWLEQHMQQHMDPKKYSLTCSHCDSEFKNRPALKTHLNSLTGEAPFTCRPCDNDAMYDSDLSSNSSALYSDGPKLIQSRQGRIQIQDQGYILCMNKTTKNNHTYFRCVSRDKKNLRTRCNATASVVGPLEEGKFKILFHAVEKHNHEPNTLARLDKQFNMLFKRACLEKVDVPIPTIFEEIKINFLTTLPPAEQPLYQEKLSSAAKNKCMIGYRVRDALGYMGLASECGLGLNEDALLIDEASGL